jgi:hypothetical protein
MALAIERRLQAVLAGCGSSTLPPSAGFAPYPVHRAVAGKAATEEPVVTTTKGAVQGFVDERGVVNFRGIPFAAPPVGARRFKRAVPAEPWSGMRQCKSFGAVSWQHTPEPGQVCSEDCLFLNVQIKAGSAGAPVFVWVHGGGFTGGAGSNAGYDGAAALAQDGLCVVTINCACAPPTGTPWRAHPADQRRPIDCCAQIVSVRWAGRSSRTATPTAVYGTKLLHCNGFKKKLRCSGAIRATSLWRESQPGAPPCSHSSPLHWLTHSSTNVSPCRSWAIRL